MADAPPARPAPQAPPSVLPPFPTTPASPPLSPRASLAAAAVPPPPLVPSPTSLLLSPRGSLLSAIPPPPTSLPPAPAAVAAATPVTEPSLVIVAPSESAIDDGAEDPGAPIDSFDAVALARTRTWVTDDSMRITATLHAISAATAERLGLDAAPHPQQAQVQPPGGIARAAAAPLSAAFGTALASLCATPLFRVANDRHIGLIGASIGQNLFSDACLVAKPARAQSREVIVAKFVARDAWVAIFGMRCQHLGRQPPNETRPASFTFVHADNPFLVYDDAESAQSRRAMLCGLVAGLFLAQRVRVTCSMLERVQISKSSFSEVVFASVEK